MFLVLSVVAGIVIPMEYNEEDWAAPTEPLRAWECGKCGGTVEVWTRGYDVACECGAQYNAFGQRLRDDWASNPAWGNDDIDDMEGFERQHLDW